MKPLHGGIRNGKKESCKEKGKEEGNKEESEEKSKEEEKVIENPGKFQSDWKATIFYALVAFLFAVELGNQRE